MSRKRKSTEKIRKRLERVSKTKLRRVAAQVGVDVPTAESKENIVRALLKRRISSERLGRALVDVRAFDAAAMLGDKLALRMKDIGNLRADMVALKTDVCESSDAELRQVCTVLDQRIGARMEQQMPQVTQLIQREIARVWTEKVERLLKDQIGKHCVEFLSRRVSDKVRKRRQEVTLRR